MQLHQRIARILALPDSVPHTARHVLHALAAHCNGKGQCWPSIATLCQETGIPRRSLQRSLQLLARLDLVRIAPRGYRSNVYMLHLPKPPVSRNRGATVTPPCATVAHRTVQEQYRRAEPTPENVVRLFPEAKGALPS